MLKTTHKRVAFTLFVGLASIAACGRSAPSDFSPAYGFGSGGALPASGPSSQSTGVGASANGGASSGGAMEAIGSASIASASSAASGGGSPDAGDGGTNDAGPPDAGPCGWAPYNDGLSGAVINDVMFDTRAQPPVVYAAGGNNLYRSTDSGHTWNTQGTSTTGIGLLATPGTDSNVLLASSNTGLIKSTDAGKTWSVVALDGVALTAIAVAPSNPLRVYVGAHGTGIFRSDDGGMTWNALNQGYPYGDTLAITVAPDNPDEVVASAQTLNAQNGWDGNAIVSRTTNGGVLWAPVIPSGVGSIYNLRRCSSNPAILYAATWTGVTRSADRGVTWSVPSGAAPADNVAITPGACDDIVASAYGIGPEHSTDGGKTFGPPLTTGLNLSPIGTYPGGLAIDPVHPGGIVLGSHGGIWSTTDGGQQWNGTQGLHAVAATSLSTSPTNPSRLWLTSWGSGIWERPSSDQPWERIPLTALPTDYAFNISADPLVQERVLVGAWSTLYQSNDATVFSAAPVSQNEFGFAFDPSNHDVLYSVTQLNGVYKSIDGGVTWNPSNNGLVPWDQQLGFPVIDVGSIVIDPSAPQTLYIGTNGRGIYKSTDGAASWTSILAPTEAIGCLLAVPGAPTLIYACVAGGGVKRTADGGSTWTDVTSGLPSLNAKSLALDGVTGDVFAADGPDLFVKHGDQSWTALDAACTPGGAPSSPTVFVDQGQRFVAVGANGGVFVHPL